MQSVEVVGYHFFPFADLPPSPDKLADKFPYLKTPTLSEKKRARLLARLKVKSDKMRREFALLTDRTKEELTKQNITSEKLKTLIKCPFNKLLGLFESEIGMNDLFFKLQDHLSFFDHEFLSLIIRRHCQELIPDLDIYVSELKEYCKRRIVEVPLDVFKGEDADENSLFVKCDKSFESIILDDILDLQSRLSELLGVDLFLLRAEDGCTELVFDAMCPVLPLTKSQKDQLAKMGIIKLYSVHYKSEKGSSSPKTQPVIRLKQNTSSGTDISDYEMNAIAEEVQLTNKMAELAEALEMTSEIVTVGDNAGMLLKLWQERAAKTDIPERPFLLYHLARIGLQDLHTKYVYIQLMLTSCMI